MSKKHKEKKASLMRDNNKRTGTNETENNDWHCKYISEDQIVLESKEME